MSSANSLKGLRYNSSIKRFYPYDNLVSGVTGFFDSMENNASSGIEYYFNNILLGEELEVKHDILDNGTIDFNDTPIKSGKNITFGRNVSFQD